MRAYLLNNAYKVGKNEGTKIMQRCPPGEIVSDNFNGAGIIVLFDAKEVLQYMTNKQEGI